MGFGRTGAICEKDKIMQILPGSSNDGALINSSGRFCNMRLASCLTRLRLMVHPRSKTTSELQIASIFGPVP
jgi:hypothetical protein